MQDVNLTKLHVNRWLGQFNYHSFYKSSYILNPIRVERLYFVVFTNYVPSPYVRENVKQMTNRSYFLKPHPNPLVQLK